MGWAVVFLALFTYCTDINGQSSWTQPPSSSVSLGGTTSLGCTRTQSSYNIYWYQQKDGQAPHFVHCDGCNRGEGIPNRFTATRSGSTGSLALTNAEAEDEADYYCASWNNAGNQLHSDEFLWGSVTKTFVLPLETETTCIITCLNRGLD